MERVKSQFCGFQWNGERGKRASPAPAGRGVCAAAARYPESLSSVRCAGRQQGDRMEEAKY